MNVIWFRRDLRIDDQAALYHALKMADPTTPVVAIFIFDPNQLQSLPKQDRRVSFIWQALMSLRVELRTLNVPLVIEYGDPVERLTQFCQRHAVKNMFVNVDYEPETRRRDKAVKDALQVLHITTHWYKDQVIFHQQEIVKADQSPYQVFTAYARQWRKQLSHLNLQPYIAQPHSHYITLNSPISALDQINFQLVNLGIQNIDANSSGAKRQLSLFLNRISNYHTTRDFPALDATSRLSVHLRFGTLSIRQCVRSALESIGQGAATGAEKWLTELIWRDFYAQLLWHFPHTMTQPFQMRYKNLTYKFNAAYWQAWCEGQTGYPLVDAAMRQLNQTGFMHNRLRMITANFLCKDLLIDWRLGEHYFAQQLLDYDAASNIGGWQWCASVGCDAQPYFRIFNPITQSKTYDPDGHFILQYIPELAGLSGKYLHQPNLIQKGLFTKPYPAPIVEHDLQRHKALAMFKNL